MLEFAQGMSMLLLLIIGALLWLIGIPIAIVFLLSKYTDIDYNDVIQGDILLGWWVLTCIVILTL